MGGMNVNWYALFVKTGKEDAVKHQILTRLGDANCKCCVPKRRVPEKKNGQVSHVVKTMFPGYVFIQLEMNFDIYYEIKTIPNIHSLLNFTNKKDKELQQNNAEETFFKYIPNEEMTRLLTLINFESDVMEYSQLLIKNGRVTILSGPLVGKEGLLKKIDKHKSRAKLSINFMGGEKLIDVGFEALSWTTNDSEPGNLTSYISWIELRKRIEAILQELLQLPAEISVDNELWNNGINSISFIRFIFNLESEFGIELFGDDLRIEKWSTVDEVVNMIRDRVQIKGNKQPLYKKEGVWNWSYSP